MKRTAHVALVVMAAAGIGGTAYSMMPREDCVRSDGGAPVDPSAPTCRNSSGSGSGGGHGSRSIWGAWGGSNSGGSSTSTTPTAFSSSSAGITHGGFGSFAHAIAAHIGG